MKSGTNWLGSLLGSHQQVSVVGEYHWQELLNPLLENFKKHPVYEDEAYCESTRLRFEQLIRDSLEELAEPNSILIGERTPQPIAPMVIRNVPVISIVRDGRDVLVSRAFHLHNYPKFHKLFERAPELMETHQAFKDDPWYFKKHPEKLLCNHRLVWESVTYWSRHLAGDRETVEENPDLRVKFVKYESLHKDTDGERRRLFEFLNVDPNRAAPIQGDLTPGFEEETPNEFFRKGAVGDWKNYFTDDVKLWFKKEGGEELIRQGYESSNDW